MKNCVSVLFPSLFVFALQCLFCSRVLHLLSVAIERYPNTICHKIVEKFQVFVMLFGSRMLFVLEYPEASKVFLL